MTTSSADFYQQPAASTDLEFHFAGTVVTTTKGSFDIQTNQQTVRCLVNASTEFAIRLKKPRFDFAKRKVSVACQPSTDGKPLRVEFDLPDTELFLLTQFRSASQMNRLLATRPVRVNHYLISPTPIEPQPPTADDLLMAGTILTTGPAPELQIGDETFPIILGFHGATLIGRSLSDLTVGKTKVAVTGKVNSDGKIIATTVLFQPF